MEDTQKLQLLFQTLGDSNRLRIINFIGDQNRSVSEIVEATGLSQPLISHHLKTLRESQVLETKRSGPFIYYRLKDPRLLSALGIFFEISNSIEDREANDSMFCAPPWWRMHWK
ncbi:MAG TPA: metalloregulator ArsR/SmtB family transcription factor [Clostridia bacterium]|nr:metalloregulator ArsR/SmtB family transcription factor [Clostridia bacterium]